MEIRVLFPARFNRAIRVIRAIIRYIIFNSAVLITPSGVVFKEKHLCYPLNPCSINNFRIICGNSCSKKRVIRVQMQFVFPVGWFGVDMLFNIWRKVANSVQNFFCYFKKFAYICNLYKQLRNYSAGGSRLSRNYFSTICLSKPCLSVG